jgi:hypothetical protein
MSRIFLSNNRRSDTRIAKVTLRFSAKILFKEAKNTILDLRHREVIKEERNYVKREY